MAALVGVAGSQGLRFELPAVATLGRATGCAILLADPLVSSRHAEIRLDPDGEYRIVDLGATHGTYVNGTRVAAATLVDGDEIIVGATQLAFEHPLSKHRAATATVDPVDRQVVRVRTAMPAATFPDGAALGLPPDARAEYDRLRVAYECGRALTVPLELDDLLTRIIEHAFELVPAERGAILLRDPDDRLVARIARRRDGETGDVKIPRSIVDAVVTERVGVIASDASLDIRFGKAQSVMSEGVRAALAVPMIHGGDLVGVVYLDARAVGVFAERDLAIIATVGGQAALAVVTARLRASLDAQARAGAAAQVAAGLAHDFGNLLTTIIGTAQMISHTLGPDGGDELRELVGRIDAAATHGARLTRRLGALARGGRSQPRALDLDELVADTATLLRAVLGRTEVEVTRAGAPCPVLADPAELEQVLLNLAFNARDAMSGAGRIAIAVRRLDGPGQVVLAVTDDGCGMPAEVVRRAFEPLFTTKAPGRGTGMGLALVHRLVTLAGGRIAIDSVVGRGTTIEIRWPLIAPAPVVAVAAAARGAGEHLVVVDGDDGVRGVTHAVLDRAGYRVTAVATGDQALAVLADHPVAALIVDLGVSGMTGRQLAERARGLCPDVALVYVSAYTETEEVDEITAAGDEFVPKPFGGELVGRIRAALAREPRPQPPARIELPVEYADGAAMLARYDDKARTVAVPCEGPHDLGARVDIAATFVDSQRTFRVPGRIVERTPGAAKVAAEDTGLIDLVVAHARGDSVPYFRRAHRRIPARLPVRLTTTAGLIIATHTQEISAGGLMLSTDHMIPEGTEVAMRIKFPGADAVVAVGGTIRSVMRTGPRRGVGIEFAFRSVEQRTAVARQVALLERRQ